MERKLKSKSKRAKELKLPMFQGGIEPKRLKELDKWDAERPSKTNRKVKAWLALRKREALKIDPRTAEVTWAWRGFDPYGVETDVPPELDCRSREWFVRRPGSDIWVWSGDLPESTDKALRERRPRSKR